MGTARSALPGGLRRRAPRSAGLVERLAGRKGTRAIPRSDARRKPRRRNSEELQMYLGLEENSGLIYEGNSNPEIPAIPLPTVTQATIVEKPADLSHLPGSVATSPRSWMFREDSFDPV